MLELQITLISGKTFSFSRCSLPIKDSRGFYVSIGSYDANYHFCVAHGKTEKLTLSYALTHLHNVFNIDNYKYV